ncbi:DNA polymerase III subunit delta [Porphyromonas sp. COT-239 OH1446]|nr:DNA polymerase III subunit delta [Porphyromonas sp. COT-239 OH1446]
MLSYDDIVRSLKRKQPKRIYMLWGEEPLFIDRLAELFATQLIPEDERDFNQTILYGNDTQIGDVLTEAMRFPMLGERHLVLVREAQQIKDLERLSGYIPRLPETTCLVLCYKKKIDKRKALYKALEEAEALYESAKIYDSKVPDFIIKSFAAEGMSIDQRTAYIMADHTGNDLEKILGEIQKLSIALGPGRHIVTTEHIEEYIGLSKEYNNFELLRAIIERDAARAYKIALYFSANERNYPVQMTLAVLYNFFSALMGVYYMPQASDKAIAEALRVSTYAARDYIVASRVYSSMATFNIIRQIRLSDAASKGVDASISDGEILKELVSYILAQ